MAKKPKPRAAVAMKAAALVSPPLTEDQLPVRARRALRDRDVAVAGLRAFDLMAMAFLERRSGASVRPLESGPGDEPVDGHRPSVRYGPRVSGSGGDPVGGMTASLLDGESVVPVDAIPAEVSRVYADLAEASRLARKAVSRLKRLQRNPTADDLDGHHCTCCGALITGVGEDRLRSGYGPACYNAWVRRGRPDRASFEAQRRAELDEKRKAS
jgi:hypothetical protein